MKKTNKEIANALSRFADLLHDSDNNPYRVRAFRRAAYSISQLDEEIETLLKQHFDLTSIPGIGKGIASVIMNLILSNKEPVIKEKILSDLTDIPGIGKTRVRELNKHNVFTKTQLIRAIKKNQLSDIKWLNQKFIDTQLNKPKSFAIKRFIRLYHAIPVVSHLLKHFHSIDEITWFESCGEYRRKKEIVSEFIFLIHAPHFTQAMNEFSHAKGVKHIINQDDESIVVLLWNSMKLTIYNVALNAIGAAFIFYTGSKKHIKLLNDEAIKMGYQLKENGLFHENKIIASNEEEIYNALNLDYIEPELREGTHEITAAKTHQLPKLIELNDIKGDLHSHTNETDGKDSLEAMVRGAIEKGYEYFAITDHSKRLAITNGLDEKRLLQQIEKINELNASLPEILILKSIEVDILADGSLDLSNEVLKELDIVVASVHSLFKLPEKKQTDRILKAMDNPYFNILGHATGRLIRARPAYAVSIERILTAAKERGCFIELNSQPYRLDINDIYCQLAKTIGVKIAISSDAHSIRELDFMKLGINQARRGWLEKKEVINTYSWNELKRLLKRY